MDVQKAAAALPLGQQVIPAPKRAEAEDRAWVPACGNTSPAAKLQQELHAAVAQQDSLAQEELPFIERAIRLMSRAAGYILLAGAVGMIGWLVV